MSSSNLVYQQLADQALAEMKAQGLVVTPLDLGDAGSILTWAEPWQGPVPQSMNATALYSPGANPAKSCHFSLLMMTEGALPGVNGHEVWTAFCRQLGARLSPIDVFLEPASERLTLRYSQILMAGCTPRLTEVVEHLFYVGQFLLPAVERIDFSFWTPDHARECADGFMTQVNSLGVLG
jgi:hypothetical protein